MVSVDVKKIKKKQEEKAKLTKFFNTKVYNMRGGKMPSYSYDLAYKAEKKYHRALSTLYHLIEWSVEIISVVENNIDKTYLEEIHESLDLLQELLHTRDLNVKLVQYLQKLMELVRNYFQLGADVSESLEGEQPVATLKNWDNPPELLEMTEEMEKTIKAEASAGGYGGGFEYSKFYHVMKLEKCRKCGFLFKKRDFTFVDDKMDMLYCTSCGQRYQVLNPEGKVHCFK